MTHSVFQSVKFMKLKIYNVASLWVYYNIIYIQQYQERSQQEVIGC